MELTINKIAAGVVGLAMIAGLAFAFTATQAHALTLSELVELFIALEVIPADKADEARTVITNDTTSAPTGAVVCTGTFSRNLSVGDTGADVKELQQLLNAKGYTVATGGSAGSPGMETEYYGPATAGAVTAMQNAFAGEILAPLGLTTGTGFFGASTRAKANTLCSATTPTTPTVPGDEDDTETTSGNNLSGGEASLSSFRRLGSPSSEEVGEGDEEVQVAGWEFDVDDADVELNRVSVRFEATTGDSGFSSKPYEYFDSVQLFLGSEMIAEMDSNSKSDWSDLTGDAWEMRFTGLKEKIDEGDTAELYVAVTVANLDTEDEGTTWNVWIADNGIRAVDAAGIQQYEGDANLLAEAGYERDFSTQSATANDELKVTLSSSNPKASIIKVDETSSTQDVTILAFTMKAEGHDILLDGEFPVRVLVGSNTGDFTDIVSDIKLEIDGTTFDQWTIPSAAASTTLVTFDLSDDEYTIDKDDTVTVKLIVDLNKVNGNYAASDTLTASVEGGDVDGIDATGGDTLSNTEKTGSAIGEIQQLQSQGIFAEIVSINETKTAGDSNANDVGDYVFKLDLTAFEDTFYVGSTSASVNYHVENGSGATIATSSTSALTSSATKESQNYRISDGATETFTYTVSLNPDVTGFYRVVVDSITYGIDALTPTGLTHTVSPTSDFESDVLSLNA